VLGEVDGGFEVMNNGSTPRASPWRRSRVGRARRCFDYALAYAAERKQFGQQIAKFQGVSFQVADMITEIDAADWLTLAAAWRLDQGLPANREIASAKLYASEMLARVTDTTLQIFGGMGLMDDFPIERFWRDARVERIWDGTSEIQRHIISRDLFRPWAWEPDASACSRCRAFCAPGRSPSSAAEPGAAGASSRNAARSGFPAGLAGASDAGEVAGVPASRRSRTCPRHPTRPSSG
jgi:hypothetical protein